MKNTKILWANAAGRCSFTECGLKLCMDSTQEKDFLIGEAELEFKKKSGAIFISKITQGNECKHIKSIVNLILKTNF